MARNTYGGETLPVLPFKKFWVKCPACGKHCLMFNNNANCGGVFFKCKQCNKEFEIKITLGVQEK